MLTTALALLLAAAPAAAPFELVPGARYDARIPGPQQVLGHDFGAEITPPDGITLYLKTLAAAAPDRTRLVEYGRSWQGRPLHVLAIGSPERISQLDAVKAKLGRFADPRQHAAGEGEALLKELPVVTWLLHSVHGNEISSSDAALVLARHLLAAQGDADVDAVLRESIVLIDPLQNPDGRARYVAQNQLGRAAEPDAEPASAEHDEGWPGGRSNHYLFDMNRDWFALTQPETRGRVKLALEWFPHVSVDMHEMGGDSTYYFAPPADPDNPYITEAQHRWFDRFGRANADRFDGRGFAYFVREVFDSFYPGYGESWPIFQGAIGMTYEQASARGLRWRRTDDTVLTYAQTVLQHATASLQTAVTAAKNREALLRDYLEYRRSAVAAAGPGPREYVLAPGGDPSRAARLAALLAFQGVEVRRAEEPVKLGTRTLPAGSYLVSAAQPSGRLVRNLLEAHVPLPEEFVKRQLQRRADRLRDEIYDVTAWSLPLLFDVEAVGSDRALAVKSSPVAGVIDDFGSPAPATAARPLPAARVGYLLPWGSAAAETVAEALRAGLKGRVAGDTFKLAGRDYGVGAVLFRNSENGPDLAAALGAIASRHGAEVVAVASGYVDDGISLGSGEVQPLRAPRVLLLWDAPASSLSAGWTRWVLERRFGQRTTAVRTNTLRRVDLRRFDVIVIPSGDYSAALAGEGVRRLKDWVRTGGTLITLGEASRWAAKEKVGLLATRTELKGGSPEVEEEEGGADKGKKPAAAKDDKPFDYDKAITPDKERPDLTPGALLRVMLETRHWLAAGHDDETAALVESQRVFTPIKLDEGRNVGTYAEADKLVLSGLAWDEAKKQLARKSYLIHQPVGDGHVVAFAEDPNYRGYAEATSLLFMNAVLFGPAF
jgi:hypothetical protein